MVTWQNGQLTKTKSRSTDILYYLIKCIIFINKNLVNIRPHLTVLFSKVDLSVTVTFECVNFTELQFFSKGQSTDICDSKIFSSSWDNILAFQLIENVL